MTRKSPSPYCYSLEFEMPLLELFGSTSSWDGTASTFQSPLKVGEAIRKSAKRLRARLEELVTADDRLLLISKSKIDAIIRTCRELGKKEGAELRMMGYLLHLVAILLGFDWLDGKPNREVIYFQSQEQQKKDDRQRHPKDSSINSVVALALRRYEIVNTLFTEGMRVSQISEVMSIPESRVKDILVREGKVLREFQSKLT